MIRLAVIPSEVEEPALSLSKGSHIPAGQGADRSLDCARDDEQKEMERRTFKNGTADVRLCMK